MTAISESRPFPFWQPDDNRFDLPSLFPRAAPADGERQPARAVGAVPSAAHLPVGAVARQAGQEHLGGHAHARTTVKEFD